MPNIIKHSIEINGHQTSVSLEESFWKSLLEIAKVQGKSANQIATEIDATNPPNLSSALRVFVLGYYKNAKLGSP